MTKLISLMSIVFVFTASFSQNISTRELDPFSKIKISQGINAYLIKGNSPKVKIETTGIDVENVITEVFGNRLKISLEKNKWKNQKVTVWVTYKEINEIVTSSAANLFTKNAIVTDNLVLEASSASNIEALVDVNELETNASSAAHITLSGEASYYYVNTSSAAKVNADDLSAKNVQINASSGSQAKVCATKEIEAKASSGASIKYQGEPKTINISKSSGGSVKKTRY